jgi:D-alanine-D-alanine ligase
MTPQQPKISVMVLMGGYTSEFGISLKSGGVVCEELDATKYDVYPCIVTKDEWYYQETPQLKHPVNPGSLSITKDDQIILPMAISQHFVNYSKFLKRVPIFTLPP